MVEQLLCNIKNKSIIYRYVSSLFGVCTYFIVENELVVIIDPGKFDNYVFEWLNSFRYKKKLIYITHEHFDHHYSANEILKFENTFLFCPSVSFLNAIKDIRLNLSYYYNDSIETIAKFQFDSSNLLVIKTPGHSKESYCYKYYDILFGGDTLVEEKYLVLKLPGSNRNDFKNSIEKLKFYLNRNTIVLPGHGEIFQFKI